MWKNQKKQNNALTLMRFCNHINANHTLFEIDQKQNKMRKKARWKTKPTNLSKKFTDKRKKLTINFIFHDDGDDDDGGDGLCLCFVYLTYALN